MNHTPRSIMPSRQLHKLAQPLKSEGITGFTYAIFQDYPNKKRCRTLLLHSSEQLLESYINAVPDYPEDAFIETQNFPLHKNSVFHPKDSRYLTHHTPLLDLYNSYNITSEISLCFRDPLLNRSELFWFYSQDENPDWFTQQLENVPSLYKFILFFKEQITKTIKNPLLDEHEIFSLFPDEIKNISENIPDAFQQDSIEIKKYHFGYPFIESLSSKEFKVLDLYFTGSTTKEIAASLYISTRTVEKHFENILAKTVCRHFKELRHALFRCPLFYDLACHGIKQRTLRNLNY